MQTSSAIVLHLKLLASQAAPHWPLVAQALILKDYALTIMLLSQPDVGVEAPRRFEHPTVVDSKRHHGIGSNNDFPATSPGNGGKSHADVAPSSSGCSGAFCCWELYGRGAALSGTGVGNGVSSGGGGNHQVPFVCSASSAAASQSMISNPCRSFLHVLMQHSPHDLEVFAKVLIPVINNSSTWHVFDAKAMPGRTFAVPNWLDATYHLLRPMVVQVVAPALQVNYCYERERKCQH